MDREKADHIENLRGIMRDSMRQVMSEERMTGDERAASESGLEVKTALGSAKVYGGRDLNTVATLLTLLGVGILLAIVFIHMTDSRESGKEFANAVREQTTAMREQTQATREGNCLARFSETERPMRAEWCKQISR